ncbi:MAG: AI-2E family transporter [Herpetosiphonaceae bacterium]|nr:AI-2E family transporter [Herpetosiphonaceae bacterium]
MMERDQFPTDPRIRTVRHELSLRSVFSVLAILGSLWVVWRIWQILLLLIIALVLAGTLSPIVGWLERHHVRRNWGLGLVLLMLVAAIAGVGALVVPALVTQISDLIASAPTIQAHLASYLVQVPALARGADMIRGVGAERLLAPLGAYALTFAGAAATVVVLGLTTVVLAFYLLADSERVKGFIFALLPRRFHLRSARILLDMETVVGGYVRGQVLTSVLIGIFTFIILWIAGTPSPLALAVVAAFADLIPFVGGALVILPAGLATLTQGVLPAALVCLALLGYLQLESHILVPRIYGQVLRLSPLAVVIALLIGGELLGIVGALLALPVAAGFRVVIEQLRIELPGEQPTEGTQHVLDAQAEALYAQQTEGVSAVNAAEIATVIAEHEQEQEQALSGQLETPIEERDATTLAPPPLATPAAHS